MATATRTKRRTIPRELQTAIRRQTGEQLTPIAYMSGVSKQSRSPGPGQTRAESHNDLVNRQHIAYECVRIEKGLIALGYKPRKARGDAVATIVRDLRCSDRTVRKAILEFSSQAQANIDGYLAILRARGRIT